MKKKFISPTITAYKYAVITQVGGSGGTGGTGGAHDAGNGGADCSLTASHGNKSCAEPSLKNSSTILGCVI